MAIKLFILKINPCNNDLITSYFDDYLMGQPDYFSNNNK